MPYSSLTGFQTGSGQMGFSDKILRTVCDDRNIVYDNIRLL